MGQSRRYSPHCGGQKQGLPIEGLDTNDSFSFTFAGAGTFDYFCGLHPHMVGKIIVE
jgi:plastocyanin